MKKLSLTIVLCLSVALSFGQKKAVSDAKREISSSNPNFEDARILIKSALENPETKDNAETWFIAGKIEGKQFDIESAKEKIGMEAPDEKMMYSALKNIKPFFDVADSLDMLPNEKGKIKPRFRKDIKVIMTANRVYYINGGVYFYNNKDYPNAFDMFQQFFDIPKMSMFEGDNNIAANDTAYAQYKYYAALSLLQYADTTKIIPFFESIKDNNGQFEEDIYKHLIALYEQTGDTINLIGTLKEGSQKFPNEQYFTLNLINQYIFTNQGDAAIELLTKAIDNMPDRSDLYNALGIVYENSKKDLVTAKSYYEKALAINPDYVEAIGNIGRIYFNQAVEAQAAANDIKDNEQYKIARAKSDEIFKEALPYFEKAHQMNPDDREYLIALSRIYYVLGDKRYDEIEKKLNQSY